MSATTENYSESQYRNSEGTPCRLCTKKNDYYYNIFTSIVASQITVEDALYNLVDLKVSGCCGRWPACHYMSHMLKKLIEFYDFRNICHESDEELRKFSSRNNFRSFEGGGAVDDNFGPSVETKDCIQDAIENNSQPTCSAQTTEIFIPVPDCLLPRGDKSFQVIDKDEGNLSEENYPVLYTSDPTGISTDVSDPLATDELSNPVTYKCPSVKEDHISDDEDGYRLNDCTDGASSKLIHRDISGQSDPVTYERSSVKNEISDDEEGDVVNDCYNGATSKPVCQESSNQPITLTASQSEKVEAQDTGAVVVDMEWMLIGVKREPSLEESDQLFLGEDGDPIERSAIAHDSATKAFGVQTTDGIAIQKTPYLPAEGNVRSYSNDECNGPTALVTQSDFNAGASLVKTERHLMDEDLEKCGAPDTDMKTNSSIPDDRQYNVRNNKSQKLSGTRGAKTFFGEKGGFDAPNTMNSLRNTRINRIERNACETLVGDKEEMPNCSINNPRSSNRSNKYSFCCQDAFNDKSELIKHSKSHSVAHNFDAVAESSIAEKSYSCSVCKKSFSLHNDLVSHMCSHTEKRHFSCNECEKSFSNKSLLVRHIRTHTGEKPFTCNLREKTFSGESALVRHVHTHTGEKPYLCSAWNKPFSRPYDLVSHMRSHTGEKPFSCNECEKSFLNKYCLVRHIRTHTGEKPFSCNECEKSFSDMSSLVRHVRKHTGGKLYSCSICCKSFTRKCILNAHIRTHKGDRHFSCIECEKSFSSRYHLVRHIRIHTGEKPFSCNECEKSYSDMSSLVRHVRKHTGEKPYTCSICSKCFTERGSLNRHIRTHKGERPHSCNYCEKSFSNKSHLVSHIRTHTGEKPYSCTICSKSFSERGSLNSHIRTHTGEKPYSCSECEKSFSNKSHLVIHIRTHTGEKPYSCTICSKSFTQRGSLNAHIRSHVGERPYTCNLCEKSFSNKSHLVRHVRTHSGKKPF